MSIECLHFIPFLQPLSHHFLRIRLSPHSFLTNYVASFPKGIVCVHRLFGGGLLAAVIYGDRWPRTPEQRFSREATILFRPLIALSSASFQHYAAGIFCWWLPVLEGWSAPHHHPLPVKQANGRREGGGWPSSHFTVIGKSRPAVTRPSWGRYTRHS